MASSDMQFIAIILFLVLIILIVILIFERRLSKLRLVMEEEKTGEMRRAQELAQRLFNQWSQDGLDISRNEIKDTLKKEFEIQLEAWKRQEEEKIRKDAIQKSINSLLGRIGEEFSPVLLSDRFGINLKDFRHLGTPVDFVAFKGLSDNDENMEILFLEIKSGKSSGLLERERKVRDAVNEKRVRYEIVNINDAIGNLKNGLDLSTSL